MPLHACASQLAAYSTSKNVDLTLRHGFENLSPPNVSCPSPFPCPKGLLLVGGLWKKTVHTSNSTILISETMSTDTFVLFFSRIRHLSPDLHALRGTDSYRLLSPHFCRESLDVDWSFSTFFMYCRLNTRSFFKTPTCLSKCTLHRLFAPTFP